MHRRSFLVSGCALAIVAALLPTPAFAQDAIPAFPADTLQKFWVKWQDVRQRLPWNLPPDEAEQVFHAVIRSGFGADLPIRFVDEDEHVITLTGTRTNFQNLFLDWTTSAPIAGETQHSFVLFHMTPV